MKDRAFHRPLVHALIILALGAFVYSNTLHVPFVFDDEFSILDNPEIRNLSGFLKGILSGKASYSNRYVGFLTFALNHHFGGLDVTGYHLVNLLIHLVNALLVYTLLILTFRTPVLRNSLLQGAARPVALLAGALFVVHPLQTQAVTYIVQRLTSLATTFYLSTIVFYVLARLNGGRNRVFTARGWGFYLASLVTAVLAMRTKEITFTIPALILLYELFFLDGPRSKRFSVLAPHLLTLLIIPLGMLDLGRPAGEIIGELRSATEFKPTATRYEYLVTQFRVIVTYIRMLFWPSGQNLDHDFPVYSTFLTPPVFLSFFLLAGLILLAFYFYRVSSRVSDGSPSSMIAFLPFRAVDPATRLISFGIFWFFITLSVESSLIPITDVFFEHRVYLPSVGVFSAMATAFIMVMMKSGRKGIIRGLSILAVAVVLALALAAWTRNEVWRDQVTLWRDAAEKSPNKARPFNNLGAVLGEAGRMGEAIEALIQATRLSPDDAESFVNLGAALASSGRLNEATKVLSNVVRLRPGSPDALNNLGIVLKDAGRVNEAIATLTEAVKINPDHAKAHFNLGRAFLLTGQRKKGVAALKRAIELKPDYDNAVVELAATLNEDSLHKEASALLGPNIARLANRSDARFHLGAAAYCTGDIATASRELAVLQQLDTRYAEQLASFMSRPCRKE